MIFAYVALAAPCVLFAENSDSGFRQWNSKSGTSLLAKFESMKGASLEELVITLVADSGKEISVRYDQLSSEDQLWIRERQKERSKDGSAATIEIAALDSKTKSFEILTEKDVKSVSELLFPKKITRSQAFCKESPCAGDSGG